MQRRTRLRKALVPFALMALTTGGLAACGSDSGSGGSTGGGDDALAVTLITKTSTNPFFIAMQEGAKAAGKENNVTITTAAGKEDGDEATQI